MSVSNDVKKTFGAILLSVTALSIAGCGDSGGGDSENVEQQLAASLFAAGSRVKAVYSPTNVRATAGGVLLGTQPVGSPGVVVAGPAVAWGINWYKVDFTSGVDGWVGADGLVLADTQTPTVPAGLTAAVVSSTEINLSWVASTDDVKVAGYKIFRNATQIGTTTTTTYSNTGLSAGTSYSYTVSAYDASGNTSGHSTTVSATTPVGLPMTVNGNLQSWLNAAAQGNPILLRNSQVFASTQATYVPPAIDAAGWVFRSEAEKLLPIAFAAADPSSPHRGRADLVRNSIERIDWLASHFMSDGTLGVADPNINRFALGPVLDSILYLQGLPAAQWPSGVTWPNKAQTMAQLKLAIQHQRNLSDGLISTERLLGPLFSYANQDVYILLMLGQVGSLNLSAAGDPARITRTLQKLSKSLYQDGGIAYIGQDTESPVYHQVDTIILARYYTLTRDAEALRLLKATVNYWPLTMTEMGGVQLQQTAPWMKQYWHGNMGNEPESLIIVAALTGDMRNVQMLAALLSNKAASSYGGILKSGSIYALPYWTPQLTSMIQQATKSRALPEHFLVSDANSRGASGRDGTWYYSIFQGRGFRNTFVGGAISPSTPTTEVSPIIEPSAAFRGARIKVRLTDNSLLWMSEKNDTTCLALAPNASAVLGARYTLQASKWPNISDVTTSPTPWQVTQVWRATPQGMVGSVVLEAKQNMANVQSIVGQVLLGPQALAAHGTDTWSSGPLSAKVFEHFGTASAKTSISHTDNDSNTLSGMTWPGIEFDLPINGAVTSGQRFVYSVWVGPSTQTPPSSVATVLTPTYGFRAQWGQSPVVAATFDPAQDRCN